MPDEYRHNGLFSPSQLKKADACLSAWIYHYLHGCKGEEKPWLVFGKLIHAHLESYVKHGNVLSPVFDQEVVDSLIQLAARQPGDTDEKAMQRVAKANAYLDEAPKRALMATSAIPDPERYPMIAETQFELDTTLVYPGPRVQWSPNSRMDLIVNVNGYPLFPGMPATWLLIDYKSTRGKQVTGSGFDPWYYVPAPERLKEDPQLLLYGLAVLLATGAERIQCRWVYVLSELDRKPQVKPVDVLLARDEAIRGAKKWVELAQYLMQWVQLSWQYGPPPESETSRHLPVIQFPDPQSPCKQYGGCAHHITRNGRCNAGMNVQSLFGLTL